MISFSWDQRIRRAEQLAGEYPASAQMLRFYMQVAQFQKSVYETVRAEIARRLWPAAVEQDYPRLLQLVQRVDPGAIAERARQLEENGRGFTEVLAAPDTSDLRFFARVLLQPYMEYMAIHQASSIPDGKTWCPICGEHAEMAVLRGEGGGAKRWLVCGLCSNEWEFQRILCPNCGEDDPHRLPVYTAADFNHVRLEACNGCHTYFKAVDLTRNGLAVPCVDELATIPLDLWAQEAGYQKIHSNLLGL